MAVVPKSDLAKALLQLNPGEDRKMASEIRIVNKLKEKANRTGEYRRKIFLTTLHQRRSKRAQKSQKGGREKM